MSQSEINSNENTECCCDDELEKYIVDGETAATIRTAIIYVEAIDKKNLKKYKVKLKKAQTLEDKKKWDEMVKGAKSRLDMYEEILVKFD